MPPVQRILDPEPVLSLDAYLRAGGGRGLDAARALGPAATIDEVLALLKESGGLDKLHLAFYQENDLEGDGVWDIWRVEGPGFVWHFRGAPHVHAYVNIGRIKA